jgi:hypothetical protein
MTHPPRPRHCRTFLYSSCTGRSDNPDVNSSGSRLPRVTARGQDPTRDDTGEAGVGHEIATPISWVRNDNEFILDPGCASPSLEDKTPHDKRSYWTRLKRMTKGSGGGSKGEVICYCFAALNPPRRTVEMDSRVSPGNCPRTRCGSRMTTEGEGKTRLPQPLRGFAMTRPGGDNAPPPYSGSQVPARDDMREVDVGHEIATARLRRTSQ